MVRFAAEERAPLTGVPNQPNVFYVGQGDGGVWKSDDYGRTWTPIFEDQPSQSIGAIAIAPSDPNIVYAASGEGLQRPDLSVGDGIYKSTDAGKTWTHLGLRDAQQIPALAVDPHDPNHIFAAVLGHPYGPNDERGIFVSTDGGQTWKTPLYKDQDTGGSDIQIDPTNPDVLYASLWKVRQGPWEDGNEYNKIGGGLFKSTDGGNTWRPLTNGLPKDLVQIYVAIAPSQPSRLYATIGTAKPGDYSSGAGLGFYRSDDGGKAGTLQQSTVARLTASAEATCPSRKWIRKILTWFTAPASSPCAQQTVQKPGSVFAALRAAMIIRTSGSTRTIRKRSCWSAIKAPWSP